MRDAQALAAGPDRPATRPRSAPASRSRKPAAKAGTDRSASIVARAFKRPGVIIAGAVFAAVMTGIVANAVVFQKGHHPAPLFAAPEAIAPVAAQPVAAAVPDQRTAVDAVPQPAAEPAAPAPVADPGTGTIAAPKPKHHVAAAHPAAKPDAKAKAHPRPGTDPISQLLKGKASHETAKAPAKPKHTVASAPQATEDQH